MATIRKLGIQDYLSIWQEMKHFTTHRNENTPDELWILEHYPVYTQGQAGKPEHILNPRDIPIVQSDRGGQVTYHGPGQLIVYTLLDIERIKMGVRTLVSRLEQSLISLLEHYQIHASIQCGAPGVYVDDKKIASIGLRVKNGRTYHGIALNVSMDLTPFNGINPCGYQSLKMTQISDFADNVSLDTLAEEFIHLFLPAIGQEIR